MRLLGILGVGGFGREVYPIVKSNLDLSVEFRQYDEVCFVETIRTREMYEGVLCISIDEFIRLECDEKMFTIAIADAEIRRQMSMDLVSMGFTPASIKAETARIAETASIGPGSIMCDFSIVTADTIIGSYFQLNLHSYVAHDCKIGDYVTFAPGVHCNGNVQIGDGAYVGTGAMLREGSGHQPLKIGKNAVVGMGAVVLNDVPDGATVVGNPARILRA